MSSDNYYHIKQALDTGLWGVYHGFASDSRDHQKLRSPEFNTRAEAAEFYLDQDLGWGGDYYSEYGLV